MANWWDIAGQVVGGGLSWLGAQEQSKAALSGAQLQSQAITDAAREASEAAVPWAVGGLGGTADYDAASRSALMSLSPELGDIYQGALTRSGLWGQQAGEYGPDPFAAADVFYNQQQPYYQQQEDQLRTDLETRQLAQGRLGGTGGARQFGELEQAIGQNQNQRRIQSFSQAQAMVDSLLGRETGDLATSTGLLNIPLQYGNLGRGVGGDLGRVAAAGLESRADASKVLGNTFAVANNSMGSGLQALGGLFSDRFNQPKQ